MIVDPSEDSRKPLKLKDLKMWLQMLPNEFLEYDLITANNGILSNGALIYEKEYNIRAFDVDLENKCILFLRTIDESPRTQSGIFLP